MSDPARQLQDAQRAQQLYRDNELTHSRHITELNKQLDETNTKERIELQKIEKDYTKKRESYEQEQDTLHKEIEKIQTKLRDIQKDVLSDSARTQKEFASKRNRIMTAKNKEERGQRTSRDHLARADELARSATAALHSSTTKSASSPRSARRQNYR